MIFLVRKRQCLINMHYSAKADIFEIKLFIVGVFVAVTLFFLPSCQKKTPPSNSPIYYQVFLRSFADSNGDGIGDLKGLIKPLPYLERLGVNGVWL